MRRSTIQDGDRVVAIHQASDEIVTIFGHGAYRGKSIPPDLGGITHLCVQANIPTAVIELDDGETVYGCECHWGGEDIIRQWIGDRHVEKVGIRDIRRNAGLRNPGDQDGA